MTEPKRLEQQKDRYALVDGIPFRLPVACRNSPALFAVFPIDLAEARRLLPGNEVHPLRLWNKALLVVSVIDYRETNIGKYIEFSIAIACTHGARPAPRFLPVLLQKTYGVGQYVVDLPVSTEISVKGGKGIWGMPKHQANLDYRIEDEWVSSQYDLDGELGMRIEVRRPRKAWLPFKTGAANYCEFRGMLMKSYIYFRGKVGFTMFDKTAARITIGTHPRVQPLKSLGIGDPIVTAFIPEANGVLDDHFENWFIGEEQPVAAHGEGMESVIGLGLGQEWLAPPVAAGRGASVKAAGGGK